MGSESIEERKIRHEISHHHKEIVVEWFKAVVSALALLGIAATALGYVVSQREGENSRHHQTSLAIFRPLLEKKAAYCVDATKVAAFLAIHNADEKPEQKKMEHQLYVLGAGPIDFVGHHELSSAFASFTAEYNRIAAAYYHPGNYHPERANDELKTKLVPLAKKVGIACGTIGPALDEKLLSTK